MKLSESLNKLITKLLKDNPILRDDFMKLLAVVWRNEISEEDHKKSVFHLLGEIYNHKLTHPESLRRTSQQIQEEIPQLRGEKWKKRQKYAKNDFKEELRVNADNIKPQKSIDLFTEL